MCWYAYIATPKPLSNLIFRPNPQEGPPPLLHFSRIEATDDAIRDNLVRPLFKAPNLYYVGSSSGCSCHLAHTGMEFDDEGNISYQWDESAQALLDFIRQYAMEEPLEMYAIWEDALDDGLANQPLEYVEIAVSRLTMENYFDLTSRRFYTFRNLS